MLLRSFPKIFFESNFFYPQAESGYGSENSLKRHGSAISLISNTQSTTSVGSLNKKGIRGLKEKLAEIETFKDILVQQIDTLQKFFDECADCPKNQEDQVDGENAVAVSTQAIDFKGEALTFKATSEGVIATLQHCVDLVVQREDAWRKRWDKEMDKKKKLQDFCKRLKDQLVVQLSESGRPRVVIHGGPDYEVNKK